MSINIYKTYDSTFENNNIINIIHISNLTEMVGTLLFYRVNWSAQGEYHG